MTDEQNYLKRLLHWGPISTLVVTLYVTLTTWTWWPPAASFITSAHFGIFLVLNLLATQNFVKAVITGPGLLPKRWHPMHCKAIKFLQYCKKCEGYKAPRCHHCRRCDRCVMKMDHHCPWINHCVGWANHAHFVYFLLFYMLSNLHAAVVLSYNGYIFLYIIYHQLSVEYEHNAPQGTIHLSFFSLFMCITSIGLSVGIVLCMMKLLFIQITGILKNTTDVEQWIVQKACHRRHMSKCQLLQQFIYPYDLGWYSNLSQVFNVEAQNRSKGIEWPVRKGCDQYTLTREQLAQKYDKRNRTLTFKCIKYVTGHWLPIWSQGLIVTICAPCSNDPRICLEPNDIIRVTRIREHWLYGERVLSDIEDHKGRKQDIVKGWFPRCCAVDITDTHPTKNKQ